MGIIDSTIHRLECSGCDIVEEHKILDKGSQYGGSHWGSGCEFKNFNTIWDGESGKKEPSMIDAVCKHCKSKAVHTSKYGG
ncbi:hypothetical protein [Aeromonas caviae]|uniref:hypothetical protein n=1 Tax=Aeromonas caviae TaxID=648 RepID=UPI002B49F1C7|nr:hypothetical protein [Aeromonas caviae]